MSSAAKVVSVRRSEIEPELKQFVDECLVPLLVGDALKELAAEKPLAPTRPRVIKSARPLSSAPRR